jgi:ribonuclease HI
LIIQEDNFVYPATVSDLWMPNKKEWNIPLITKLFGIQNANMVAGIPINNDNGDDILIWKYTSSGICTSKSAYQLFSPTFYGLNAEPHQTIPSHLRSILQEIWKCDNIPPRVQVFGWRLLRGALATGMRAGARSKHIDPTCSRCGKKEDDFHLFFDCKFSQAVWFASPLGLRVEGLNHMENTQIQDIIHYILVSSKNKDTLKIVLSILWSIWKARNDLLFNKINCSPLQVLFKAKAIQLEKEEAQTRKDRKVRSCQTTSDWSRSESGLNIYTDAAWKDGDHSLKAGIGIYLDWNREDHKAIYMQASSSATSALQAETQAMEVAAQIAKKLKIKKPKFLTDNSILAQTLKLQDLKKNPGHWMIRPNLQQFIYHTQGMQASIHKIKRENNKEAHGLAKEAFSAHGYRNLLF